MMQDCSPSCSESSRREPLNYCTTTELVDELKSHLKRMDSLRSKCAIGETVAHVHNAIIKHQHQSRVKLQKLDTVTNFVVGISIFELLKDYHIDHDLKLIYNVLRSLSYLLDQGLIYTSIDDYHYLSLALE